jgi:hypothetical protein
MIMLLAIANIVNAQKNDPIKVYSNGELLFSFSEDSVILNGAIPLRMDHINYYTHQWDSESNIHYFCSAYQLPLGEGCARFDVQFRLYITEDERFFYSYTDACEGFNIWKGDESLPSLFEPENIISNGHKYK